MKNLDGNPEVIMDYFFFFCIRTNILFSGLLHFAIFFREGVVPASQTSGCRAGAVGGREPCGVVAAGRVAEVAGEGGGSRFSSQLRQPRVALLLAHSWVAGLVQQRHHSRAFRKVAKREERRFGIVNLAGVFQEESGRPIAEKWSFFFIIFYYSFWSDPSFHSSHLAFCTT